MDDTSSNALNTEENTSLIEFPCDFPIKVMGVYHDEFSVIILDVVQRTHVRITVPFALAVKATIWAQPLLLM